MLLDTPPNPVLLAITRTIIYEMIDHKIANSQNGIQVYFCLLRPNPNSFQLLSLANISSGFRISIAEIPVRYNKPA